MRRSAGISTRILLVLGLGAAALDLPLPARNDARVRIHLVDRSGSVLVPGPVESLAPRDSDDLIARDRQLARRDDVVTWASFGRDVAFESRAVDPSASSLSAALEAALARNPTEIILHSDGRASAGTAAFLCKDRGVPVHVLPLGPLSVKDARLVRIEAPADLAAGEAAPVEVSVESTFETPARLSLGAASRALTLHPGIPQTVRFEGVGAGDFQVHLDVSDACPENNRAAARILLRSERRRVLVLGGALPDLPGTDWIRAALPPALADFDAVIASDADLAPEAQERLRAWVRAGGALLLTGGSAGLSRWQSTPLGEISPLSPLPDQRVAVVFGVDVSGSMNEPGKLDLIVPFVIEARRFFDPKDDVVAMTFAEHAELLGSLTDLKRARATGGTHLAAGIDRARLHLETRPAGRKHILLLSDGETSGEEKPEMRREAVRRLNGIGLTIITPGKKVDVGEHIAIRDWTALDAAFTRLFAGIKETERGGGPLEYRDHPAVRGLPRLAPAKIFRGSARADAQVAAVIGRAPAEDPVLAFRAEGLGRVGTLAFPLGAGFERLLGQTLDYLIGEGAALRLSIEGSRVQARGSGPPELTAASDLGPIPLRQSGPGLWEGRLPGDLSKSVLVRLGRARALLLPACPPEFEHLGVDLPALERLAAETGGRRLDSLAGLEALPRPRRQGSRSGRNTFLLAALLLLFADLAIATFWKAGGR